jgi:hypothetical protein
VRYTAVQNECSDEDNTWVNGRNNDVQKNLVATSLGLVDIPPTGQTAYERCIRGAGRLLNPDLDKKPRRIGQS